MKKIFFLVVNLALFSFGVNAQENCELGVDIEVGIKNLDAVLANSKIKGLSEKYGELTFVNILEENYFIKCNGSPTFMDFDDCGDAFVEELKSTQLFSYAKSMPNFGYIMHAGHDECPYGLEFLAVIEDGIDLKNCEEIERLQEKYNDGLVFIEVTVLDTKKCEIYWEESINEIILKDCGTTLLEDLRQSGAFKEVNGGVLMPTAISSTTESDIRISPNPVKGVLQLTLPTANNVIKILNVQGKTVLQTECGEIASVNVSLLPAGTYVLMVNNKESQRFVKQ